MTPVLKLLPRDSSCGEKRCDRGRCCDGPWGREASSIQHLLLELTLCLHRGYTMYVKWGVSVAILAAVVGIYLLPSPIDPEPFVFERPPPALVGPLAVNRKLHEARRIFYGQLKGPESFTSDKDGNIYTGTVDGKLWKISGEELFFITQMGQNVSECGIPEYEPICGRPHGIRMNKDGDLIVADSYFGLFKVNPQTGERTLLLSSEEGVDGISFRFLNGLELSQNGTIFFTDSSSKWGRRHHRYEVLEANHLGRLIKYDPVRQQAETLLDGLYMANGLALSPSEDFVLIAETSICRISRYWLTGNKKGVRDVFMDNMPGYPDNIRLSSQGTYRVGLSTTRFPGFFPPFLDATASHPTLKRFIVKVFPLSFYNVLLRKHGLFLEVSNQGEILESFHDPDGSVTWAISDVFEHHGKLYLGNTDLPFLVILTKEQ
ncbi:adipocyte plasma membrane-associated protein-like [Spea bombifrons]|uniref:adipocyte plasma membrane-associated protein-like n=1 Tax=Spea bombifrons TaxID=233779 RepID=UPI002349747C|nr:adipocyte plasma membrane-associated protein-like [Spea bombifrons]